MNTFGQFQAEATKTPLSLRNNRDRINLPVLGLQEEAGKIGTLLTRSFATGSLELTQEQRLEIKGRLADALWYVALICAETNTPMAEVAEFSLAQLSARTKGLDPDRR